MSYDSLSDFLEPIDMHVLSEDMGYKERQIGKLIEVNEGHLPEVDEADIVLIGCNEQRGGGSFAESTSADAIRKEFFNLYYWHNDISCGRQDRAMHLRALAGANIVHLFISAAHYFSSRSPTWATFLISLGLSLLGGLEGQRPSK